VKSILRQDASDEPIRNFVSALWSNRNDRYSEERGDQTNSKAEMSYLGG
jgi:cyclic pyranopterin phosphate synthase